MSVARIYPPIIIALLLVIGLSACHQDEEELELLNDTLVDIIDAHGLTGDPADGRNLPEITDGKAQLGKALFFTKSLGGAFDAACVSCHHPMLGGGDGLSLPVGVDAVDQDGERAHNLLGLGRFHLLAGNLPSVSRNAPTIFNVGLYDAGLFWDSSVASLGKELGANGTSSGIVTPDSTGLSVADSLLLLGASLSDAQARFPVISVPQMRSSFQSGESNEALRAALLSRFEGRATWEELFVEAYGDPIISFNRIAAALGAYENSQVFIETPWKAYIDGDEDALTDKQKQGARLFYTSINAGGAGCVNCHSGDFFTDEKHHLLAFPQFGEGKNNDSGNGSSNDFGRENVTELAADRFHFRTPTLLNAEITAPYGHAGTYQTLEEAIAHHINPAAQLKTFFGEVNGEPYVEAADFCDLPQIAQIITVSGDACNDLYANAYEDSQAALAAMEDSNATSVLELASDITEEQIDQLVAFIKALTDPCVLDRECLSPWIIDADDLDDFPDGEALVAVDQEGNEL